MKTILLSPEQIHDCEGCPWLREATPEEHEKFKAEHPLILSVDPNFRPYFPMVVDEHHKDFPPHLQEQISRALRIFRFWEKPMGQ